MKHILLFFVLLPSLLYAQQKPKASFGLSFDNYFDNREFDRGGNTYNNSSTIFASRLTPYVDVSFKENISAARKFSGENSPYHSFKLGLNVFKDFGKPQSFEDYFKGLVAFYDFKKVLGKTQFALTAGIFPRQKSVGHYSNAFFSDSLMFYDPDIEGLMFQFIRPRAHYEIACDWIGMKGPGNRERFMILSSGESEVARSFVLGYAAMIYHFASSDEVWGVVDNVLLNPYMRYDFSRNTAFQEISLSLGWLQGAQCDRRLVGKYSFPCGAELVAEARIRNVGIQNRSFYGKNMMPYYNSCDAGGFKYGNNLYHGDPFYRVRATPDLTPAFCDRAEVYWEPFVSKFMSLRLAALFYFNEGYEGCRQTISVKFKL